MAEQQRSDGVGGAISTESLKKLDELRSKLEEEQPATVRGRVLGVSSNPSEVATQPDQVTAAEAIDRIVAQIPEDEEAPIPTAVFKDLAELESKPEISVSELVEAVDSNELTMLNGHITGAIAEALAVAVESGALSVGHDGRYSASDEKYIPIIEAISKKLQASDLPKWRTTFNRRLQEAIDRADKQDIDHALNHALVGREESTTVLNDPEIQALRLRGYAAAAKDWMFHLTPEGMKYGTATKQERLMKVFEYAAKAGIDPYDIAGDDVDLINLVTHFKEDQAKITRANWEH